MRVGCSDDTDRACNGGLLRWENGKNKAIRKNRGLLFQYMLSCIVACGVIGDYWVGYAGANRVGIGAADAMYGI